MSSSPNNIFLFKIWIMQPNDNSKIRDFPINNNKNENKIINLTRVISKCKL